MTVAHRRTLRSLQLGTALATTLFAGGMATPAFGQALPVVNNAGGATINNDGTTFAVDLGGANRVISYDSFNVDTGKAVTFATSVPATQLAVLNRVTVINGTNASNIAGTVSSPSNIVVWLSNPNGILVGPSGSFNTGGLVLTTLNVDPMAFLATGGAAEGGAFSLTGGTGAITIGGALTTTGSGGLVGTLLVASPQIAVNRTTATAGKIAASGAAALVAASDANFTAGIGSPLSVTITAGSVIANGASLIDVSDSSGNAAATISGESVALVGASDSTVMGALLNVGTGASLTATGSNGAVVLATKDTGSIAFLDAMSAPTTNGDAIVSNGSLSATGTGGDVIIAADGAATAAGAVSANDAYTVSGSSVILGDVNGGAVAQSAGGNIDITATAGDIVGHSGLTLTSNSAGATNGYVLLDAGTTGAINFSFDSDIITGPNAAGATGAVGLIYNPMTDIVLGDVTAQSLGNATRNMMAAPTFGTMLSTSGTIAARSITVGDAVDFTAGADMRIASLDADTIDLTVGGDLTGLPGVAPGLPDTGFGGANLTSRVGAVTATAGGLVQLTDVVGETGIAITAGSATSDGSIYANGLTTNAAVGDIVLTAVSDDATDLRYNGDIRISDTSAAGAISLSNSGGAVGDILAVGGLTAGTGVTVSAADTATIARSVTASAGDYTVTGGDIVLGTDGLTETQSASGAVSLTPGMGGGITLAGDVILESTGAGDVSLNGTVDGAHALTVKTSGDTLFAGAVGTNAALTALTTDLGGATAIDGGAVTTAGLQTYGDAVTLGAATTTLTNTAMGAAGRIIFNGTVDGASALTVNAANAGVQFDEAVGDTAALTSLSVTGITELFGVSVETTGAQSYGPLNLNADTTLTGSALTFGGTVLSQGGAFDLTANAATVAFTGAVGDIGVGDKRLGDLVVNGDTTISGGVVSTTGDQTYSGGLTLGAGATLSGATPTFAAGVTGGGNSLTLNFSGTTAIDGATFTGLGALATGGGGTTTLTGPISTTGGQTYSDAVMLVGATDLTSTMGGAIDFASTVDGAQALSVTTAGLTIFRDAVGGMPGGALASLTTDANGTTTIHGGTVTTTGPQTYNDPVTLSTDTTLVSTGAMAMGDITFASTVSSTDQTQGLTVTTAGTTTFGGAVGGTATSSTALEFLTADGGGTTAINGGSVRTIGAQTYADAVALGMDTTLTGGSGSFAAGVTGNNRDLTLNLGGTTALDGSFMGIKNLATGGGGSTALSGTISTSGSQTFNEDVLLTGGTTLTTANNGAVSFNARLDGGFDLLVNSGGATSFAGPVGSLADLASLTTDMAGTTVIGGGLVETSGSQTYNDAVTLGAAATTLASGTGAIAFLSTLNGASALTVNAANGLTTFGGLVGNTAPLLSIATDAGGGTAINAASVTTSGAQDYGDTVTLGASTTLSGTTASFAAGIVGMNRDLTLNFSGATVIDGTVTGVEDLVTNAGGSTRFNGGTVTTTATQTYNDQVVLGASTVFTGTSGNFAAGLDGNGSDLTLTFSGPSALTGAFTVDNLVVNGGNVTAIAGTIATVGGQTYSDAIQLPVASTLSSSNAGTIAFGSTIDGPAGLTVTTGGATTFAGAVGGDGVTGTALASLTVNGIGGTTALNGGSVRTTGGQTYGNALTLGNATTLTSTGGGAIDLAGTVDGAHALAVNTAGLTIFRSPVGGMGPLASLTTDSPGTTTIHGGMVTTTGAQTYNDPLTLSTDTTLISTGMGDIAFASTVRSLDQTQGLTVTTAGTTTFGGIVGGGAGTALEFLTTDGGGITAINGGAVTTTGAQTYSDATTLGTTTTLTSTMGGQVRFANTLNGPGSLNVSTTGLTRFDGIVGGSSPLASLSTGQGGVAINTTAITTAGAQNYNSAVTLGADTTLDAGAAAVTFVSTIDGAQALTVNTTGNTVFGGAVGGNGVTGTPLTSLTTNAGGTTVIVGGSIRTSGAQNYGDAVALLTDTTLTGASGTFAAAGLDANGNDLTLNFGGTTAITGNFTEIDNLTTGGGGTTSLTGTITTTGAQTYGEAVTLAGATMLNAGAGQAIAFASTVDGAQALSVNTTGATTFGGAVGGMPGAALASLSTDTGGATAINGGSVTTSGAQNYGDAVVLGNATTLTSSGNGDIVFNDTVNSDSTAARALTVTTGGSTAFLGEVGGAMNGALASLTTNGGGTTDLNGGAVTTIGGQTYSDDVVLTDDTILTSTMSGAIAFAGKIDSDDVTTPRALTVTTAGATTFGGAVGTVALASLTANGGGATAINGGSVTTTGAQTYSDPVTLGLATTLSGATGTFAAIAGGGFDLTLNFSGLTTLGGPVSNVEDLLTDASGTTAINGGSVSTLATQTYGDDVTLGATTTLSSGGSGAAGDIAFAKTLNGGFALSVNTQGTTTFGGAVGAAMGGALASLATDAGGTTAINGGGVTTSGAQIYGDAVTLGLDTTLTSTMAGAIDFGATVDGARALNINTAGLTIFRGAVGGMPGGALASLTTDGPGTTTIHGGTVSTTGSQTYNDAVTLSTDTTLNAGADITFAATLDGLDGMQGLTANAGGAVALDGVTGGNQPLEFLIVAAASADIADATVSGAAQVTTTGATQIGSLDAGTIALDGGQVTATTLTAAGNISAIGDVVTVTAATAGGALGLTADVGSLTLGTGSAGTTATLTKTGGAGELTVTNSVTGGSGVTISSSTDARIANATATTGNLSASASGALTGVSGGRANLAATTGALSASAGTNALLGTLTAGASATLSAGTLLDVTTVTAGTDATLTGASVAAGSVTATNGALSATATGGDLTLGTGSAGTTATLTATGALGVTALTAGTNATLQGANVTAGTVTASGGALSITANAGGLTLGTGSAGTTATLTASGDIVLTSKLTAGGNIALGAGDDVFVASYDQAADTGLIRSTAGDVSIDAGGSVVGIGAGENTLPTTQRGVAALSTTGNLTINSDGDARFDSLGASGSIALNIAGSLTGAPLSGGTSTGTNVPGGAVLAQGTGGDVTIRSGLAGAPSLDTVVLHRVIADRNISISADQLAIGTLTTNSGTITLNDTSGAALSADNYYVGMLNSAGDLVVVLTGQPTAAIPLVAPDANGAPEFFDANFGKTDLAAGTAITGSIGRAAQLGDVSFATALDLDTAALVADTLSSTNGSADITASTGTLAILTAQLGGALTLTKQGGSAGTAGDELRLRSGTVGGNATLTSATHQRIGALSVGGDATLAATNDLTGLLGASSGTSDTAYGRADLSIAGNATLTSGGLTQLGAASAGGALSVTAGNAASDGAIDIATAQAGTALSLVAQANAPVADAAHDGDIRLGTATAGATLLISNVVTGGDSGDIVASGTIQAGGDARIDAANDATLATVNSGGSLGLRARRDATTAALTAAEDIGVSASRNAGLGALNAGDDVLVTSGGSLTVASATASGAGPDTRTVSFASPTTIAFPAETNPGADIVLTSTGSSVTANGPLAAASDVSVASGGFAALLGSVTATSGDVTVQAGTGAQLANDVASGADTAITAGTGATVQQNVTAGGNYTVTAVTGISLGDGSAHTQQANGAVTIASTNNNVTQGSGRLTLVGNADRTGAETLTISAANGAIVLNNSQLIGGSIAGRESDVVLSASGAITADDLDGDRVGMTAGGNIVADTIEAGTGAADSGDLADRQSVDLVSTGGSVTVNTGQAFGAGHDIDIRAANALSANNLAAGGSLVGRAGQAIALGAATAGEDVALRSNGSTLTITGATTAGDDVLLTAAGAIATGPVTASGTGPDTRTVVFGSGALDAAYAAETNPGADIVIASTGAGTTANGPVTAASDVTVNAATSVTHLSTTTATAGNVTVNSGASTRLVGDVTSGIDTTIAAGTTAALEQNVTAGRNYTVTGGTGVTLGDASARTQQANGNVTITATSGDIAKGAGRLTIIANADRTAANNADALTINAVNGNIVLANSQLTGGSIAGRESDIRLTARGITVGKVDGASLTARATTGFTANEAIVAGNAARGSDPVNGASTVDIAVSGGGLSFTDITATNAGHDIVLNASGAISGNNITAARAVAVNGGSVAVSGGTTASASSVTVNGGASASLGSLSAATTGAVTAGTINVGAATTGSTLSLNATGSTLTLGSATSGGDVTLAAQTRATLGPITATGRTVTLTAADADINGNIAATTINVIDRASGGNPLRLGDGAPASGGFALSQAEFNRLNAPTVVLDAGTTGGGAQQDVAIGALAIDADTGSTRLDVLGLQRFDVTGTISAMGNGARTFRFGGSAAANTRATTMRFATTADSGGRVLVPGVALDLRADRIGMGFDANFLATLGLTPGGTPADQNTVAVNYISNGSSTLYVPDFFGAGAYSDQTILTADSLTLRYSDYALFQNTGGTGVNAGAMLASLSDPSMPALVLAGPNPPNAGGFAIFGTINGVPDSATAVLGDQVITLTAVDRLNARVNGCIIGSGSGCIASTASQPPLPPLNAFRGDIFSSQGDLSIPFDPVVGTNNESLFGDVGSFGLSDLPLQPLECDPDEEGDCAREGEEPRQ